jgi:hypothetical protein
VPAADGQGPDAAAVWAPSAPVVHADEPVRAYKRAVLVADEHLARAGFTGIVQRGDVYGVEANYRCAVGRVHDLLPVDSCRCGFYALEDRPSILVGVPAPVRLTVELFGRVVRHEHCLRAERQVVLQTELSPWCSCCAAPAVGVAAVRIARDALPVGWRRLLSVCSAHGDRRAHGPLLAPVDVAGLLGTEVVMTAPAPG